jgi:hypothetical protein
MDPRHKLYKTLSNLSVDPDPDTVMSENTDNATTQAAASSGVTLDGIKTKLEQALGATHVEIEDMSGKYADLFLSCLQLKAYDHYAILPCFEENNVAVAVHRSMHCCASILEGVTSVAHI